VLPIALLTACSAPQASKAPEKPAPPVYFKVDPITAATVQGTIKFIGKRIPRKAVDMSNDPACKTAHKGPVYEESEVVNPNGTLANVFVYIKTGLEG
jgi:hypothetical protein